MRIGILTGGGDCPGLNAVIRAVVRTCDVRYGSSVVGFLDGWRGLLEDRRIQLRNDDRNDRLLAKGGTMLGTARVNPDKLRAGLDQIKQTLDDNGIDVLIPIGGEGTLTAAHWLSEENVPVVGVPKTIDNDIDCTDVTFGHDTALQRRHRGHRPAAQHRRVAPARDARRGDGPPRRLDRAERRAGLGRAHDADPRAAVRRRRGVPAGQAALPARDVALHLRGGRGRQAGRGLDAVARGRDRRVRAREVHRRRPAAGASRSRSGSTRRCGSRCSVTSSAAARPTPYDRVLATRFGVNAADAAHAGEYGMMVSLRGPGHRAGAAGRRGAPAQAGAAEPLRRRRRVLRLSRRPICETIWRERDDRV